MSSSGTNSFASCERVTLSVKHVKHTTRVTPKQREDADKDTVLSNSLVRKNYHLTKSFSQKRPFKVSSDNGNNLKVLAILQAKNPDQEEESKLDYAQVKKVNADGSKKTTENQTEKPKENQANYPDEDEEVKLEKKQTKNPDKNQIMQSEKNQLKKSVENVDEKIIATTFKKNTDYRQDATDKTQRTKEKACLSKITYAESMHMNTKKPIPAPSIPCTILDEDVFRIIQTKGQIECIVRRNKSETKEPRSCLFVGNIPQDVQVFELAYLFEKIGSVHSVRRMMEDSFLNKSKSFGFVTFISNADAKRAQKMYHQYEIRKRMNLIVQEAFENNMLFVGNIPKYKCKEQLFHDFSTTVQGLTNVVVYKSLAGHPNRGFCFLQFGSHKEASYAKNMLTKYNPISSFSLFIDWADALEEPDDEVMKQVKRVHVSNLSPMTSSKHIYNLFQPFGVVEKVKKIRNYAFVHFEDRESALLAIDKMNHSVVHGEEIKVVLSKPPIDVATRKSLLEKREKRLSLETKKKYGKTNPYQSHYEEAKLAWYMKNPPPQQSALYSFNYMLVPPTYQQMQSFPSPMSLQ